MSDATQHRPSWSLDGTFSPGLGRRERPRSHLRTDADTLSLDGTWRFLLHDQVPTDELPEAAAETFDDSAWETMDLPMHWVLTGDGERGRPQYTNVQYPFPIDPPHVPDTNPTADHRRTIEVPASFMRDGERQVLRLLGVESSAAIWLNGVWLGTTQGSRLTQELDATGVLHEGVNTLLVRVQQWSPGSYLEDQDQWWLPGIFRSIDLLRRPAGGLDDVWLTADFDPATGHGHLDIELRTTRFPVTVRCPDLGLDEQIYTATASIDLGPVHAWDAEDPHLYEVTVTNDAESVTVRTGFRRIEVREGVLLANGRPLKFHGVNRHETHFRQGRVFDADRARADLELMKSFNVNALRTSHYPPHPEVLDLADELGLWVVLECDYETHGFAFNQWLDNPSDDLAWREALLDRVERTVERDKNHPSIVMWSLGNESWGGRNIAAMASWIRRRDPSRLVHYENDYTVDNTDVYSRMYPPVNEVEAILAGGPMSFAGPRPGELSPAQNAAVCTKPFLMCEYLHAMGTGPGSINEYVAQMEHPRHAGGFVWEWRDHALQQGEHDERLGYGGDFGELVHDGNFVCDGLVDAHSQPRTGLVAWANAVAPVTASMTDGVVSVQNRFHTRSASGLVLAWQVLDDDGAPVAGGTQQLSGPDAGVTSTLEDLDPLQGLPAAFHGWVQLAILDPGLVPGAPGIAPRSPRQVDADGNALLPGIGERVRSGRLMSLRETRVGAPETAPRPAAPTADGSSSDAAHLEVLDDRHLVGPGDLDLGPVEPCLFRATTDNDRGEYGLDYWTDALGSSDASLPVSSQDRWLGVRLHQAQHRVMSRRREGGSSVVELRTGAPSWAWHVDTTLRFTPVAGGVRVEADLVPGGPLPAILPRMGLRMRLPLGFDAVSWVGTGPGISYTDLTAGVRHGRFEADADQIWERTIRPQEAGNHLDLRRLDLTGPAGHLSLVRTGADAVSFSLAPHQPEVMDTANHWYDLPEQQAWWLHLDTFQHGTGTRSCGPDVLPVHAGRPRIGRIDVTIRVDQR